MGYSEEVRVVVKGIGKGVLAKVIHFSHDSFLSFTNTLLSFILFPFPFFRSRLINSIRNKIRKGKEIKGMGCEGKVMK